MSNRTCPECGTLIAYSARSCSCGWGRGKAMNEPAKDYGCAAHGCPLLGSMSPSIGANGTYYCRFHFNTPLEDWAGITSRIRSGETLRNESKAREDYRAYITEKFISEGMKPIAGNLASKRGEKVAA